MTTHPAKVGRLLAAETEWVAHTLLAPDAVWTELVQGRLTITGHHVDETRVMLTLGARSPGPPRPLTRRQALIIEKVLTGCPQKVLAIDFQRSPSSISAAASHILRELGLAGCMRRAPLGLAMIASAHAEQRSLPGYRIVPGDLPGSFSVVMQRPEFTLRSQLSGAEYEILRHVVAGLPHEGVAKLRDRSHRTVANQLRSIAERLGLRGRFQFIHQAVLLACSARHPTQALAPV